MNKVKILVTGGAGFIGSHVNKLLNQKGYETVVVDRKCPPADYDMREITAVIHLAASTRVGESVEDPLAYYQNNVSYTLDLLQEMKEAGVNIFIFSSSAAVYGAPNASIIKEDHPKDPINPYGRTKLMIEEILADCDRAYDLRYCSLRYFNAAGADPEGELTTMNEHNLIPIVLRSLKNGSFKLFGRDYSTPDGTCIRDYIHVWDLARAHVYALERLINGAPSATYNLGNGEGYSVQEVLDAVERVTQKKISLTEAPRRAGDPPILIADSSLAKEELGWQPEYALDAIVADAWKVIK